MNEVNDQTTVGASETGHRVLKKLASDEIFPEMRDAYKFALALGLALKHRTSLSNRRSFLNVGSFDRDGAVADLILALLPVDPDQVYRVAEELAETGLVAMAKAAETGEFRFDDFLEMAKSGRTAI
jgi:hypothetical protein